MTVRGQLGACIESNVRTCRDECGVEAGSTSQHFFHPPVEPVSPSYLPGRPRIVTLRTSDARIRRVERADGDNNVMREHA